MKHLTMTRYNKRGGQFEKEQFYTGQRLDQMEKGKSWFVNPEKAISLSSRYQSFSQNQIKDYKQKKKDEEEYKTRYNQGLTFGGKTKRRRRHRHRTKKRAKRKYRR